MEIDPDIEKLIKTVEVGQHSVEYAALSYLESLPGFQNSQHRPLTSKKYERCLLNDKKYGFVNYAKQIGLQNIEEIKKGHIEAYKDKLLNALDPQTVRTYITPVRQLMGYCRRMEWIENDYTKEVRLPKLTKKKEIRTVPMQVQAEVLDGEWGNNPFTVARNHLVACLFLRRGLRPLEFPKIRECHIHPYRDLAYLEIFGKRDAERDVMLDEMTFEALKIYMVERAHFMHVHHVHDDHIFLSLVPRNGDYVIAKEGIQAIIRRIKHEMKMNGSLWDLSALNPQGCRRSAVSRDYERAEYSPAHHPEFTLSGQYGHSLAVAQKHYWKKSLKNAYLMTKGGAAIDETLKKKDDDPEDAKDPQNQRNIYPEGSFFRDFGIDI
jgi:site-specific recombinase XerD